MKSYLFALAPSGPGPLKPSTPQIKKPLVPALVMDSPLRESLPFQPGTPYKSISAHAKTRTPLPSYGMTPRTGALYAFGESPSRTLETINNLASKVRINFDDAQDNNDDKDDFIVKKIKPSNPILGKILEQRNEESDTEPNKLRNILLLNRNT